MDDYVDNITSHAKIQSDRLSGASYK